MDDFYDELPRLNEFTKDEWFDVAKIVKPDITEAEYDEMWAERMRAMAARERNLQLN